MAGGGYDVPSAILVEDHQIFREGVRDLLRANAIRIVGEAASAADAVALSADRKPAVALLDLRLPDATGAEAAKRIRTVSPATRVVILTASEAERDVFAALAAGACGYLLKHCPPQDIAAAVRAAAEGGSPLSPPVAALLLERLRSTPANPLAADGDDPGFTDREREVLALIAEGRENAEIADALTISQHTVKSHVSAVLAKLGVENRIQAAVYAVRKRIV